MIGEVVERFGKVGRMDGGGGEVRWSGNEDWTAGSSAMRV